MSLLLNNSVLQAAESAIEQQLTGKDRENYLRIVVAGLKVATNGGPNSPFAKLVHSTKDPIRDCVNGAIGLVGHMRKEAKGVMPTKSMVPAAMTLMLHALDVIDRAGVMKIGKPELVQATKLFSSEVFRQAKISPDMLRTAASKVHGITQDPAAVEKLHYAAGTKAAPGAPVIAQPAGGDNGV